MWIIKEFMTIFVSSIWNMIFCLPEKHLKSKIDFLALKELLMLKSELYSNFNLGKLRPNKNCNNFLPGNSNFPWHLVSYIWGFLVKMNMHHFLFLFLPSYFNLKLWSRVHALNVYMYLYSILDIAKVLWNIE